MFNISGKIAIVTGASQGIGRTIAKILSKSGAHVICIARTENKIIDLVEEIRKDDGLADYISCCLLYTSPSPRDRQKSRMPSSA